MTQELQDLICTKKIKVFALSCGLRLIGEVIDEDRDEIQLKNPLEIIREFDENGSIESFLIPLSPGNISEDTHIYTRAVNSWSKAAANLKVKYHDAVMVQVVTDCLKEHDTTLEELTNKSSDKTPKEPLDFESTTPTEVGLGGFSDSNDKKLFSLMKQFPYRNWKLN